MRQGVLAAEAELDGDCLDERHAGGPAAVARRGRSRQREHWEKVAQTLPDLWGAASTQYYRRCEQALVRRHFGPLAGKRVLKLDLWNEAGNTRLLQWMSESGAAVFGIDLSWTTTARARANFAAEGRSGHVTQSDIRWLPFADGSFDHVYTMGTIEHIAEYEDAIAEIRRVLKPGGSALIGVPFLYDPFLRPLLVWVMDQFGKYPYSPERAFSGRGLRDAVERSGLRVEFRTGLMFAPGVLRLADLYWHTRGSRLRRLTPPVLHLFEFAERRWEWARRLGYLLAVVAHKQS